MRFMTAATTPSSLTPSQLPPASLSRPATTLRRSGQWRAGGAHGRPVISSRLAPRMSGQAWSGRWRMTTLHMGDLPNFALVRYNLDPPIGGATYHSTGHSEVGIREQQQHGDVRRPRKGLRAEVQARQ